MSYILDALKKSDQERQQGTPPNLYSAHGPIPQSSNSPSTFKQHQTLLLVAIAFLLLLTGLGTFFLRYKTTFTERGLQQEASASRPMHKPQTSQTAKSEKPSDQFTRKTETSVPLVVIKEKDRVLQTIALEDRSSEPPHEIGTEDSQTSLPLLQDLSAELQAELPSLKFAGHTYALEPYHRMIIINGKILREGDMITPGTRLMEITWEGVTIDFNGTRFRVNIN